MDFSRISTLDSQIVHQLHTIELEDVTTPYKLENDDSAPRQPSPKNSRQHSPKLTPARPPPPLKRQRAFLKGPKIARHGDAQREPPRSETWLELFLDLVFVAAVTNLGEVCACALDAQGIFSTYLLFSALNHIWASLTSYANRFEGLDPFQVATFGLFSLAGCLYGLHLRSGDGVSSSVTELGMQKNCTREEDTSTFDILETALYPTISYTACLGLLALLYLQVAFHHADRKRGWLLESACFMVEACFWGASIGQTGWVRTVLWSAGRLFKLTASPIISHFGQMGSFHVGHLHRRMNVFILLYLGESIIQIITSPVDGTNYQATAALSLGICFNFAITCLHAQPHHAHQHVVYRKPKLAFLWISIHTEALLFTVFLTSVGIKLLFQGLLSTFSPRGSEYLLVCIGVGGSNLLANVVRFLHKGYHSKHSTRRLGSYIYRLILAILCLLCPVLLGTSDDYKPSELLGPIFVLGFLTVCADTFAGSNYEIAQELLQHGHSLAVKREKQRADADEADAEHDSKPDHDRLPSISRAISFALLPDLFISPGLINEFGFRGSARPSAMELGWFSRSSDTLVGPPARGSEDRSRLGRHVKHPSSNRPSAILSFDPALPPIIESGGTSRSPNHDRNDSWTLSVSPVESTSLRAKANEVASSPPLEVAPPRDLLAPPRDLLTSPPRDLNPPVRDSNSPPRKQLRESRQQLSQNSPANLLPPTLNVPKSTHPSQSPEVTAILAKKSALASLAASVDREHSHSMTTIEAEHEHEAKHSHRREEAIDYLASLTYQLPFKKRVLNTLWRCPQPCQEWGEKTHHRHESWYELFFDLMFVGGCIALGGVIKCALSPIGLLVGYMLFSALSKIWVGFTTYVNKFDSGHVFHLSMFAVITLCVALMGFNFSPPSGPSCSRPFSGTGWDVTLHVEAVVIANSVAQIVLGSLYLQVAYFYPQARTHWLMVTSSYYVSALFWLVSLATGPVARTSLWMVGHFLSHILEWLSVLFPSNASLHIPLMNTRMGMFIMLMLGESVIQIVIAGLAADHVGPTFELDTTIAFLTAFNLAVHYFQTQPHSPSQHILRRSLSGTWLFYRLHKNLAYFILLMGVGFKAVNTKLSVGVYPNHAYYWLLCSGAGVATLLTLGVRMLNQPLSTWQKLDKLNYTMVVLLAALIQTLPVLMGPKKLGVLYLLLPVFLLSSVVALSVFCHKDMAARNHAATKEHKPPQDDGE